MADAFPHIKPESKYITLKLNHGAGISQYQVVGEDTSGFAVPINATSASNQPPVGIALSAVVDGVYYPFLREGIVKDATFSFTPGKIFLSDTGQPTSTPSTGIVVVIGYYLTATSFYFQPELYIIRLTA